LTPTARTDPAALETVESFWRTLGMRTCRTSAEEHDRRLADISHLPHAVAAALVTLQDEASLALSGKGFLDITRIAGGDGGLWRDILADNRDNVRQSLARFREQLEELERLLEPGRADALQEWLDRAAHKRETMKERLE
jgi:prephenate dehydrogenase